MSDQLKFWEAMSPYLSYIEDNFLDVDSISKLAALVSEPVLVIGAGQGLLVERLMEKGFKVDGVDSAPKMIAYAKQRRNLDLILANGKKMPIDDDSYRTSIVATGVIDLLDDEEQIRSIVNEASRVTDDGGKILIAFYRFHAQSEDCMRLMGFLTDDGCWRARSMYRVSSLKPIAFLKAAGKQANVSFLSSLVKFTMHQMRLPAKEKMAMRRWAKMWRGIDNPDELIASVPESLPYRNEDAIRALFKRLGIPIKEMFVFSSCRTVQI